MDSATYISHKAGPKSATSSPMNYVKDIFAGSTEKSGSEIASGVRNMLSKTLLKGLPAPLNLIAPVIVEKVIMKYGVEEGREVLLKGLRWVKKVTDEKPGLAS
ncbi:hypothetical protein [Dyadobacter sp. CY323]|uniref:hypothetical protein n=1 Tax=Dyadobacter sp. CY323 TaxID=2907302 RepID=UPI001F390F2F|nr:hypothetical protein [Dyadobacter sp. CY323]MCE6990254.1 hypothetical protein [Dyadobacter sp. CY323]